MRALYRAGRSPLHRMTAGRKLVLLAASALVLSLVPLGAIGTGVALAVVCSLYAVAGLSLGVLAAEIWRLRWLLVVLTAMLLVFASPSAAWINAGRVTALLLLAALLTLTTRMGQLQDALVWMLRPLGRMGIDTDAVAMTLSLTITMIPVVGGFADRVRDAQRARGVRTGIRSAVTLFVMALRHADRVGDALAARGITETTPEPLRSAVGPHARVPDV